ncbi:MAG: TonB-dependent receptor [Acidobacteriota bacterium]|nr:TonB-dependent receptor [Acidobacteriota bacterium]
MHIKILGTRSTERAHEPVRLFSRATQFGRAALSAFWILLCCLAILPFAASGNAQTTGAGNIQGTVTDSTGALVPNALVTLQEASTQVTRTSKTSSAGDYAFPNINVGTYSLTVTAPGFQTYISSGNVLEVGSSIAINVKMIVGGSDIKVEVHAESLALQTEDASFKQTIDRTDVLEMPLNGRHMTDLVTLAGGSQGGSNPGDANGSKYASQSTGISIAGAPGNTVSYRLDGGDNNDYMGGENAPMPFPDAIGQFSVETAALGAQSNADIGGLVNVVTQSGTNTYHGSAFEFVRNNIINATNFFSTKPDTLHQHQYGGTFGGYIIRNKLFAFAGFQHQYTSSSSSNQDAYVPTAANLAGDFSVTDPYLAPGQAAYSTPCGPAARLIDPITGVALPGNKYNQPGGPALPQWNASALALIKQLPQINPALDPNNCGHVSYAIPSIQTDNEFDTRVDYTINSKNNMYVRYFLDSQQIPSFYSPTNILVTSQSGNPEIRWQSITIGENYVIRSNLVNSLHLTATRRQLSRGFNAATPNASAFGIKVYQPVPSGLWINIGTNSKHHGNTVGGGSNLLATINDNVPIDVSDDVTWVKGKHQLAFGGAFVRNQLNLNNGYSSNGNFSFNGQFSEVGSPGDANLDLLEGAMNSFSQTKPQQNALRGSIPTLYAQDTFHATPRLTVTAGLRWQPLLFPVDYFHRGTTFNMAAFLANQHSSVYPNAPAGTFFYGDPGVTPAFTKNSLLQFNPSFGLTYDLSGTGSTVLRAGVAYAYDQPNFFVEQRVQQNPPFSVLVAPNTSAQLCFSDPWLIGGTGNAGCGQTGGTDVSPFPQPDIPTPANATFSPQSQYIVLESKYRAPDTLQWTASIQQQYAHGWSSQIFYTGNRTQHLLAGIPLNPAVFVPGVWGAGGTGCAGVRTSGAGVNASHPFGAAGTPCSVNGNNQDTKHGIYNNQQARLALVNANPAQGNLYSGGNGGSLVEGGFSYANYNGVIVSVQHRQSSTFSLVANYTWSKCLNVSDPQADISGGQFSDPNNPRTDYGRCGQNQDARNIFNTFAVIKSAFPLHGITGYLVNNWELAPLIRLASGTAFSVTQGQDQSFTANGGDRPNFVPGVNPFNYTKIKSDNKPGQTPIYADRSYLNSAAFTLNTVPGTQGNIGRNTFSGPMYFENDAQISRIFPIRERYNLDLRLEAFNVLNHPSFSNPSSGGPTFNGGSFGQITSTSVGARVFQGAVKVSF